MNNTRVFVNSGRVASDSWNVGHGNKILHLYFVLNYAHSKQARPVVACDSSLDQIFDLSRIKEVCELPRREIYQEQSVYPKISFIEKLLYKYGFYSLAPYSLSTVFEKSHKSFLEELALIKSKNDLVEEGYLSGHYWHYQLMPDLQVVREYIQIREDLINTISSKYPELHQDEKHIAVHIRETDFKHHLRHVFKKSIALPDSYYEKAMELAEKKIGSGITYHLFSDNIERAKKIFLGKKVIIHSDSAILDWVGLHMSKSIIQSNSSFCWTASLHNKIFSVQPKGGFNWYYPDQGTIPYGFEMPNSIVIKN